MNKAYERINWENYPSDKTPLNESNLNKLDAATDVIDDRVITLDTTKATKVEVSELFSDVAFDVSTGTITFTRKNGATVVFDTKLEKLAINFAYDPKAEKLIIYLDDGTTQEVDLSALITQYEFFSSDTIAFLIDSTGGVSAIVKEGSIEEKHLRQDYLADIKVESAKAETCAAVAGKSASEAEIFASRAEQAAEAAGWADFDINDKGHLIFTKTDNLETEFSLTDNGRLEVTLV